MRQPHKLTPTQIQTAYEEYQQGGLSMIQLGKKYGVSDCAFPYHFKKLGWKGPGRKGYKKYSGGETHYECSRCKKKKPREEFKPQSVKGASRPVLNRCNSCLRLSNAAYRHSVSLASVELTFARAAGACEACGVTEESLTSRNRRLVMDHNHESGNVRGFLCDRCNLTVSKATKVDEIDLYIAYITSADSEYAVTRSNTTGLSLADAHILRTYGLTPEDYNSILDAQGHVCGCCGVAHTPSDKYPKLLVEHCHTTNKIRGLVCSACNIMAGVIDLDDDITRLHQVRIYMEKYCD